LELSLEGVCAMGLSGYGLPDEQAIGWENQQNIRGSVNAISVNVMYTMH